MDIVVAVDIVVAEEDSTLRGAVEEDTVGFRGTVDCRDIVGREHSVLLGQHRGVVGGRKEVGPVVGLLVLRMEKEGVWEDYIFLDLLRIVVHCE